MLETAAGSGVVTRALAPLLGGDSRYVVTDLNQPMLDRAVARQAPDRRIAWRQADALDLPFEDRTFDAVCCQFGAMFFPDRVSGYREARRVLKPGGRFLFNVWDRIEHNAFARIVTDAAAAMFSRRPAAFLARTPHGYHDIERIRRDLGDARTSRGSRSPRSKRSARPHSPAPRVRLYQGTPLRNEIEARAAGSLDAATDRATKAIAERHGNGPVSGKIQAHVIVAIA